ncbi:ATP-binding protein [Streptomyces bungoensis]|uniref:ATP-binding protein n=1 Tax=Streptomyces bungoensis TaxID=285568 RepID=UPI003431907C
MRARFTLPAHEALVGCLRHAVRAVLTRWRLSADERDAALLVVGELAANAAVHGRSEMSLHLVLTQGTLGLVMGDHGDPAPSHRPATDDDPDEHGRGLDIVHTLSTRVDVHCGDHGTWIMACLAVSPARREPD